ncbi:MAG: Gx transporter family protein [Spirochaetales bacterium]|nr:Gx transporter family protein [Spirochaetales bacterium]
MTSPINPHRDSDASFSSSHSSKTVALLGAFCLFLATVEFMIPKPLPFLRLGLANLPILIGLSILSPGQVISLVVIKILGQGLVNGTLFSYIFLFSAAGSMASCLVMLLTFRFGRRFISLIGISLMGALASNLVQLTFSRFTVFGQNAWLFAPPFLAAGGVTAILLGIFAEKFAATSVWMSSDPSEIERRHKS